MIVALLMFLMMPSVGWGASLWPDSATPATVDVNAAASSLEIGTEFTSDAAGTVTAIRFYKSSANAGPHRVSLWKGDGASLAMVTVGTETAAGWQTVPLPSPVALVAGATYVASYHVENGHWSRSAGYFTSAWSTPPLRAVAGHYWYGTASGFPSNVTQNNYWVDVVFAPALPGAPGPSVVATVSHGDPVGLTWAANTEIDLAGYNVYARFPGGLWGKVGTTIKPSAMVGGLAVGQTYEFSVSAFDGSNNESGKSGSVATITH